MMSSRTTDAEDTTLEKMLKGLEFIDYKRTTLDNLQYMKHN